MNLPERLKKPQEFASVRKSGAKFVRPRLILQVGDSLQDASPVGEAKEGERDGGAAGVERIGYVVSRKCGNAVKRNRIKRRLRSAVAKTFGRHAYSGKDFVLIGRAAAYDCDFADLLRDLQYALQDYDKQIATMVRKN